MKAELKWTNGMKFEAQSEGNTISMDAKTPIGTGTAMTPKELLAVGLGGCTAMDVTALLKKHKQNFEALNITVEITSSAKVQPAVFTNAVITFEATGPIDKAILIESVRLSQTKYCGVSAMLLKAFPITYVINLNNEKIGEGSADFSGGDHE